MGPQIFARDDKGFLEVHLRVNRLVCQGLDQAVHRFFLLLDGFDELELRAAAVEIMPFAMHFEIGVAGKIVGEKADADLESDEFAGEGKELLLCFGQEICRRDSR